MGFKQKYIKYKKKYLNIIKGGRLPLNVILECKFKTQTQESESGEPLTPRIPEFMFTCNNKLYSFEDALTKIERSSILVIALHGGIKEEKSNPVIEYPNSIIYSSPNDIKIAISPRLENSILYLLKNYVDTLNLNQNLNENIEDIYSRILTDISGYIRQPHIRKNYLEPYGREIIEFDNRETRPNIMMQSNDGADSIYLIEQYKPTFTKFTIEHRTKITLEILINMINENMIGVEKPIIFLLTCLDRNKKDIGSYSPSSQEGVSNPLSEVPSLELGESVLHQVLV